MPDSRPTRTISLRASLFYSVLMPVLVVSAAVFSFVIHQTWVSAIVMAAVIAASLVLVWKLSNRYNAPLEALVEQSRRIARLDLDTAPPVRSVFREINELSDSMGAMQGALRNEVEEHRRTVEALRASDEMRRYFVDNVHDVIWATDLEFRFTYVNAAMENIFGYSQEETMRLTVGDLAVTEEDRDFIESGLRRLLDGAAPLEAIEVEHQRKDGAVVVVLINATARRDANGAIIGTMGTVTDITEIKQAEKMLARSLFRESGYSQTLESEVAKRTGELENTLAELREAQGKMIVQEKLASLGSLTAGIAHEIKNPLNFVNNFAELTVELVDELRDVLGAHIAGFNEPEQSLIEESLGALRQNAAAISRHGKQADNIVQGMLAHSRGAAGEFRPINVSALLDEHVKLAYHGMRARDVGFNISIDARYDPAVLPIDAVPQDLGRVFLNIVNNGCYAMREKRQTAPSSYQPTLTVSTRELGDAVEVRIRDNGIGMPDEVRERIFNPFFTTKPAGEGTGLGLSISFDIIVQVHKGTLHVDSAPGEYTEFIITLPRHTQSPGTV